MPNLLNRVWRITIRRKFLLAEAFFCTLTAWAMIRLAPYDSWRPRLGVPVPLSSTPATGAPARNSGQPLLEDIAWAHAVLGRFFGQDLTCLMLAFSARAMLLRRKFQSVLVLGVKRGGADAKLGAHAWVLSQGYEIVGGETRDGHMPIAAYRILKKSMQE